MKSLGKTVVSAISAIMTVLLSSGIANAVTRTGGQLDYDFSDNSWHAGVAYNNAAIDLNNSQTTWSASVANGDTVYVAGMSGSRSNYPTTGRGVSVMKYVNGVADTSFGGDGTVELRVDQDDRYFNSVSDISVAGNGDLVIVGGIIDPSTYGEWQGLGFALRLNSDGGTELQSAWGNSYGAAISSLPIIAWADPMADWTSNHDLDSMTVYTRALHVTNYLEGSNEVWAIAGDSYIDGDLEETYAWVANFDASGTLLTSRGDGAGVDGFQIIDGTYDTNGFGADCDMYSVPKGLEYSETANHLIVLSDCYFEPIVMSLDQSLVPETGFAGGFVNIPSAFEDSYSAELMTLDNDGNIVLAGVSNNSPGPWVGVLDASDGTLIATMANPSETGNITLTGIGVDSSGNIYASGGVYGNNWDIYSVRFTSSYTADTSWAGGRNGGVQIDGACANEVPVTSVIAGNSLYHFGWALSEPASPSANVADAVAGPSAPFASKTFIATATQTSPAGAAPAWTDDDGGGTAFTTLPYTQGVSASGDDITYYTYTNGIPPGLSFDHATGQFSGTTTAANGNNYNSWVCASNKFGHTWTNFHVLISSGTPQAPTLTGGTTDFDGVVTRGIEMITHTIPVEGNPVPTCDVTDGELPPGLVLDGETCQISGTPRIGGDFSFVVTATNSEGSLDIDYAGSIVSDDEIAIDLSLDAAVGDTAAGAAITAYGWGLDPDSDWEATLHSTPVTLADGVATSLGWFALDTNLPSDIEPGAHELTVSGTDAQGNPVTATIYMTVGADGTISYLSTDKPEFDVLASTGISRNELGEILLLGALACAGGLATLTRRRRV